MDENYSFLWLFGSKSFEASTLGLSADALNRHRETLNSTPKHFVFKPEGSWTRMSHAAAAFGQIKLPSYQTYFIFDAVGLLDCRIDVVRAVVISAN